MFLNMYLQWQHKLSIYLRICAHCPFPIKFDGRPWRCSNSMLVLVRTH